MRRSTIIGALLAGGLALAGCTPSEEPSNVPPAPGTPPPPTAAAASGHEGSPGAEGEHTGTDKEFAQHMLAHHEQALELAKLATQNGQRPEVKDLAARIEQAQAPEVAQIRAWMSHTQGQGSGSAPEDQEPGEQQDMGMQSPQTMQALRQAQGAEFDRQWTQAMLDHHEGALQMARTELEEGSAQEMRDLAEKIIATQQAEIDELKKLQG